MFVLNATKRRGFHKMIKARVKLQNSVLYRLLREIYYFLIRSYMKFCNKIFPYNDKRAVFISFYGRTYSDNPRAISEKLHEVDPAFEIFWFFKKPESKKNVLPNYIRTCKYGTLKSYRILATSKFWIDNSTKPRFLYKHNSQIYIQTWHGDRGFKKILCDAEPRNKFNKLLETELCDLMLAGSLFGEKVIRSAFNYDGLVLNCGSPRNDKLVNYQTGINEAPNQSIWGEKKERKILLYAPTFRDKYVLDNKSQEVELDLIELLANLEKHTGYEWGIFVRAHFGVKGLDILPDDGRVLDVSAYEDMNDLLLISDILITDYSSSAGDFALLDRPIFLYQSDRESYLKSDRECYFDIEDSPFLVANSSDELYCYIEKLFQIDFKDNCEKILEFYGAYETGNAAMRVVDFILRSI